MVMHTVHMILSCLKVYKTSRQACRKSKPSEFGQLMSAGAVARIRNRNLLEAWSSWQEFCDAQQTKREQLALAVSFWTQRELATAFNQFRYVHRDSIPHISFAAVPAIYKSANSHK